MSYILDALRKADAEREQGRVPGLHSQLGHAPTASPEMPAEGPPALHTSWPLMLGAGLAGGLLAAAALWWALQSSTPPAPAPAIGTPPSAAMADVSDGTMAGTPQSPAPQVARPLVQPVPAPDLPLPRLAPPARPSPPSTSATPPAPPQEAQSTTPVQRMEELPDNIRRSLPPLVFGGAMHSDTAASRMLVINNNVYREGDEPTPGLLLEEIRLKSAVFRYQGLRFSVNY